MGYNLIYVTTLVEQRILTLQFWLYLNNEYGKKLKFLAFKKRINYVCELFVKHIFLHSFEISLFALLNIFFDLKI